MHTLVQMQHLTRKEFERNLQGLTDEDARKRIEPMNCISWIVAHVAWQQHAFFVDWPQGKESDPRYRGFATDSPASQPPLAEAMALWWASCDEADVWLHAVTKDSLQLQSPLTSPERERRHSYSTQYLSYLVPLGRNQLDPTNTRSPTTGVCQYV